MSISAFQEKIFKSGCGIVILLVSAVALSIGLFYTSCDNPSAGSPEQEGGTVAVQVGDASITSDRLQSTMQQMLAQFGQGMSDVSPRIQAFALMQALNGIIQELSSVQLASHMGVDLSDQNIRSFVIAEIDKEIQNAREEFVAAKKLKPEATAAEFAAVFKKERQQDPEEMRKATLESVDKALSDPSQRSILLAQVAPQMVVSKLKSQRTATDAEVKASYDTYTFKRILIDPTKRSAQEAEALANKVLAEVKGGGSFEQAMDRYTDDSAVPNKKKSESTTILKRPDIESNPEMKALASMKVGDISPVVKQSLGLVIYKLISVKNDAPPDFAKKTAQYKDQYIQEMVQREMQAKLQEIVKSDLVKFPLPGYKAAHEYALATADMNLMNDQAAMEAKLKSIVAAAQGATADETPGDDQAAVIVWYAAFDDLYNRATDKSALRDDRIKVLEALLRYMESFDIRMELVDMGIEAKNQDLAIQNLMSAVRANVTYDVLGDQRFRAIDDKVAKLKKAGMLPAEAEKQIADLQAEWRVAKADAAKAEREFKVEQEKMKKEADAAQKKLEVENKAAMEKQKKEAATAGSTGR